LYQTLVKEREEDSGVAVAAAAAQTRERDVAAAAQKLEREKDRLLKEAVVRANQHEALYKALLGASVMPFVGQRPVGGARSTSGKLHAHSHAHYGYLGQKCYLHIMQW
jgi:hypothetical protein